MFDPPTAGEWWLRRPELVGALSDTAARLVLVNAPAGSGKTVLVAQWCASLAGSRRCGWVCLDARDNDPARLWWHVVSALQQSYPELRAGDVLRWLWAVTPDAAGTLLPVLVNELAALSVPVVLVLDN